MCLNWEENDGEWATRINFTVKPEKVDGKSLASLMALSSAMRPAFYTSKLLD